MARAEKKTATKKVAKRAAPSVAGDLVFNLKDMEKGENPAADGKLVFRNPQAELLQVADRVGFFEELQESLDEMRSFVENLGKKHGVQLVMETVFDIQKIKFRASQVK